MGLDPMRYSVFDVLVLRLIIPQIVLYLENNRVTWSIPPFSSFVVQPTGCMRGYWIITAFYSTIAQDMHDQYAEGCYTVVLAAGRGRQEI
jgi:hypothetical protein